MRDCGNLLTRAGMRLPAVDVDTVTMNYPSPHKLVEHLRVMGETNAGVSRRRGPLGRSTAAAAAAAYGSAFPSPPGVGDTAGGFRGVRLGSFGSLLGRHRGLLGGGGGLLGAPRGGLRGAE